MRLRATTEPVLFGREHFASPWLHGAGWHKFNTYNRIPPHRMASWELAIMEVGHFSLLLGGQTVELDAGHTVVIPPGVEIATSRGSDVGVVYWLLLDPAWQGGPHTSRSRADWDRLQRALAGRQLRPVRTSTGLREAIHRLLSSIATGREHLVREGAATALAGEVLSLLERPGGESVSADTAVRPALDEIERNPENRQDLGDLARRCGLSLTRFHGEFRRATGVSPRHFINQRKMARARALLSRKSLRPTVAEVAERLGFSSSAYFAAVFRKFSGCSPSEFLLGGRGRSASP